jgi:hypothetical protein
MSRFVQTAALLILIATSGLSIADVNVCIENGVKVIRTDPCKGGVKPKVTYRSPPIERFAPATRAYVPPNRIAGRGTSDPTTPILIHGQVGSQYSQRPNQPNIIEPNSPGGTGANSQHGGGTALGGSLNGSIWPDRQGGMIHGGPLSGSIIPGSEGGMIHGGPLSGTFFPGGEGGMIHGGPLSGSIMPGNEGGMIHGGPFSGTILPPR